MEPAHLTITWNSDEKCDLLYELLAAKQFQVKRVRLSVENNVKVLEE